MKLKHLSFFAFLISFFACSLPKGEYVRSWGPGSNFLKFEKNNRVISLWGNDLGCCEYRIGKYELFEDTLVLRYGKPKWFKNYGAPNFSVENSHFKKEGTVRVTFEILDAEFIEPLPFSTISVFVKDDLITGTQSDFDGLARLDLEEFNNVFEFKVDYSGYRSQRFSLELKESAEIKVFMESEVGVSLNDIRLVPDEKKEIYTVLKNSKDSLILRQWSEDFFNSRLIKYNRQKRKYLSREKLKEIKAKYSNS